MKRTTTVIVSAIVLCSFTLGGCTSEEASAPVEFGELSFDGETGVDWTKLDVDLFAESGGVYDLAVGAGQLWALANSYSRDDHGDAGAAPVLLGSTDGRDWEVIDLTRFDIPTHYLRDAFLFADDDRIAVVLRRPVGGDDAPAVVIAELNEGELEWRATAPQQFSPWQDTDRRGLLHFPGDAAGAAWHDEQTLVMVTQAHWRPPGDPRVVGSTDQSFAIVRLRPSGGERLADSGDPLGGASMHSSGGQNVPMVAFDGTLSILAGTAQGEGRNFVQWWSTDGGVSWQSQNVATPDAVDKEGGAWLSVNHAVVTPHGILVAAANGVTTKHAMIFRSADGATWQHHEVKEASSFQRILVTDDGYYAMAARDIYDFTYSFWHSVDGAAWSALDAPFTGSVSITSAVGTPGGIVMSTEDGLWFSGELPPLALSR